MCGDVCCCTGVCARVQKHLRKLQHYSSIKQSTPSQQISKMAAQTKKQTSTAAATTPATAVATPPPATTAATTSATVAPTTTPATVAPATTAATTPATAATTPATAATPVVNDDVNARFTAVVERVQSIIGTVKDLLAELKTIQKDVTKKLKSQQGRRRRATTTGSASAGEENDATVTPRKPSGFAKPTAVSKDLCNFLSMPEGTELARTEVTRLLNKYIKDNNLQDPVDRRTIRPDQKLQALLNIKGDTQLKYFNMQSYIKHHFVKSDASAPATAVSATV